MRPFIYILLFLLLSTFSLHAQITGLEGWNIFLDPGHSQRENMGIYNYSEAEKNLGVALHLREMLLNMTDIDTVYLSRTNNQVQVSLSQRTDYANRVGAAWFHSIHSDAGAPQSNSTLLLWGQYYDGREKVPNGGKAMSDIMVTLLTRGMRTTTRGSIGDCSFYTWSDWCKTSGGPYLHINRESTMPSELSEAGFHTNPTQNQRNMNSEWKRLEAKTFLWSILKFHGLERPFVGTCAGFITDFESGEPINGARVTLNGQTFTTDTYESLFHKYSNDPDLLHNGFYYFENLPAQTLQFIVSAPGYYSDTSQVDIVDSFFTFKDVSLASTVPPRLIATTPAPGDTTFPAWQDIIFIFSRIMNRTSVENNIVITPATHLTFTWSKNDTRLALVADTLEFLTEYTITIAGAARDIYGHSFDGNGDGIGGDGFTLAFKSSAADISPPKVENIYPELSARDIELFPIINIVFNEKLATSSISDDIIILERFKDHSLVAGRLEHYIVNDQGVVCFFPLNELYPDETYVTRIYPGIRDLFGNETTARKSFSFKTTTFRDRVTLVDNFESGITSNWWVPQQSGSTTGIITQNTSRDVNSTHVNHLTASTISLKINYGWDQNASEWLIRTYLADGARPKSLHFNSSYLLQVYVFGDGSQNKFRFALDDKVPNTAAENHEVSPWYTVDWLGWRLISWDLTNDGTGDWLGDGNLDGTLRFDSIQLTFNPGNPVTGAFYFDDLRLVQKVETSVEESVVLLPEKIALSQNYPNPFNPETTIRYSIPDNLHHVQLIVYDVTGKKVRTIVDANQPEGAYLASWDGKDDNGDRVASGIFIYKLMVNDVTRVRRMVLVR